MSGISTGVGIFSGINSGQIIAQLLAIESRPKIFAQQRVVQLQQQQAAFLDLNSKLQALKTASGAFRVNNVFKSNTATSSDPNTLSATASAAAIPGSYQFIVDRLVSSQQSLSRGFASSTSGVSAGTFTFESAQARLDRDISLAELNGGAGISRGKIVITDATNNRNATIDLSRVATAQDVITAINEAPGLDVSASVQGGKFVLTSNIGGNISVTNAFGFTTATSLGIERASATSPTVTGSTIYSLGQNTTLSSLNDGNGVMLHPGVGARIDFTITVGGTAVSVNVGPKYDTAGAITEAAPTTIGGVLTRINAALAAALGNSDAAAAIAPDGVSLRIVDSQYRSIEVADNTAQGSNTAADLGLRTSSPQTGTVSGARILAGLNTTLARTLNGGSGVTGDGTISITGRDGTPRTVSVSTTATLQDIADAFGTQTGGAITATLNRTGTGLKITDTTGGTGNLIVLGTTATSLGIATEAVGVAAATITGTNLQHQYISKGTRLASLRSGQGVGTGTFRITDSLGNSQVVSIDSNDQTVDDVARDINGRNTRIKARLNDTGDGLLLYEETVGAGAAKIKVADETGAVAANLNLAGEATGTGVLNVLNGTFEKKIAFDAGDSLQTVASKITAASAGVAATVINDGTGSAPYRLSITARNSGTTGRFVLDTGAFDLGETALDAGRDARVFFGAGDPARGVLLTSSRNTLDNVITGVTIDLKSVSEDPITLSISRDTAGIEAAVNLFVSAFNSLTDSITAKTRYDAEANTRGTLLGDSTTLNLRGALYSKIQGDAIGISGSFDGLAEIGITVGSGAKLTFNRDRFRAAYEQDPQGVADVIAARVLDPNQTQTVPGTTGVTVNDPNAQTRYISQGLATQIENFADTYLNSVNGILTRKNRTITEQIDLQRTRISSMDARLETRRQILEQQFRIMEQAIGQLQTQQSALASLG